MSYSIHNYSDGNVLSANELNEMDAAILENENNISKNAKNILSTTGIYSLEIINGKISVSDGSELNGAAYLKAWAKTNNYLPVNPSDILYFSIDTDVISYIHIIGYNSNKTFLEDCVETYSSTSSFTVPDGVYYIRINFKPVSEDGTITFTDNFKIYRKNGPIFEDISLLENTLVENNNKKNELLNARFIPGLSISPLTLLHFSDIHNDKAALARIMEDREMYGELIDDVICTGDMVGNTSAESFDWWDENVLTCIGNHDTATYTDSTYNWVALSQADRITKYIKPFEENWNIIRETDKSYYYKDYPNAKVRLIVMDGLQYVSAEKDTTLATTQNDWLSNVLDSAITNEYHVLIAVHGLIKGAVQIPCSFSEYTTETYTTIFDCGLPQSTVDIIALKINNGLNFIGYISGHKHSDNIFKVADKQFMYNITTANCYYQGQWQNGDLIKDSTHDAYNLFTIDTAHNLVKIIRGGGADYPTTMIPRKTICIDYSNEKIVYDGNNEQIIKNKNNIEALQSVVEVADESDFFYQEVEFTEAVSSMTINLDYDAKTLIFEVILPAGSTTLGCSSPINVYAATDENHTKSIGLYMYNALQIGTTERHSIGKIFNQCGFWNYMWECNTSSPYVINGTVAWAMPSYQNPVIYNATVYPRLFKIFMGTNANLPAGIKFKIYGVKY